MTRDRTGARLSPRTCLFVLVACAMFVPHQRRGQETLNAAGQAAFVRWATTNAQVLASVEPADGLEDLLPIDALARSARLIGIGETDHNIHEFICLRQRLLQRLASSMEVAAVAMETGLPESREVDGWITTQTNQAPAFSHSLHYGYGRDAEMIELLRWVREYNTKRPAERQVHFYGIDIPQNGGGSLLPALEPVWAYLARVDATWADRKQTRLKGIAEKLKSAGWWMALKRYDGLPPEARDTLRTECSALAERFATHRAAYLARSTPEEFAWAECLARVAGQTERVLHEREPVANVRDVAMAENLQWVLEREGQRGRVVLFAHNLHIAAVPIEGPMVMERERQALQVRTLGQLVRRSLGDSYLAIGTACDRLGAAAGSSRLAAKPGSVDAALARVGQPLFLLRLKNAQPGDAVGWVDSPHPMRAGMSYVQVKLREAFDAVIFVQQIRAAEQIPDPVE